MKELAERLTAVLTAERVSTRAADLAAAGGDESSLPARAPDVVAWPLSTREVAAAVALAAAAGVALTARGAGSSLEGNPIPVRGGIVLDLSRMNRVLEVRPADLQVDVEPGVVYAELNRQLRPHGLFFPPSPGGSSDVATIGGMIANNASGIYSTRYGGTGEHLRAATVVTGTGEVLHLGNRCRKHSSGYDLLHLLVGSEGTLGVVTAATLSLAGLPAARRRWGFSFPNDRAATEVVAELLAGGSELAAAEFLDRATMAAINRFRGLSLAVAPALLLEAHGAAAALDELAPLVEEAAEAHGASALALPAGEDPWMAVRHYATRSVQALHPGAAIVRADLAVPISALPELVTACAAVVRQRDLDCFQFGHAGTGIVHVLIPVPGASLRDEAVLALRAELVQAALDLHGAVSGEHGMGLGNRWHARRALGPAVDVMRAIKAVFDPAGILNPGKIWEEEGRGTDG